MDKKRETFHPFAEEPPGEDEGFTGQRQSEEPGDPEQGFSLDEETFRAIDRRKLIWCGVILIAVFLISLRVWPLDVSNMYRTEEAMHMFVYGLFGGDLSQAREGGVLLLQCMLYDLAQIGRAFVIVVIAIIIMRFTVLRKKRSRR